MKINILLPYKEKFDEMKASSVSITVKNNLYHSSFLNDIKVFGQNVEKPLFNKNFFGIKYSFLSLKRKNYYLANQMLKIIMKSDDKNQIIELKKNISKEFSVAVLIIGSIENVVEHP